jgi:glutathione S-transferase
LGEFQYVDKRIEGKEWTPDVKKGMPYGQLPVLVVEPGKPGRKMIAQTKAILRYVGKLARPGGVPLYPSDPFLAAKVDEVLDAFDDLWILLAPTYRIQDKSLQEQERQRLFMPEGEGSQMVSIFERALADSAKRQSAYVVPEAGFTVADLVAFCMLNTLRSGFVEGLSTTLFDSYPHIKMHREKIASLPTIRSYYADAAKSNPTNRKHYEVFKHSQ